MPSRMPATISAYGLARWLRWVIAAPGQLGVDPRWHAVAPVKVVEARRPADVRTGPRALRLADASPSPDPRCRSIGWGIHASPEPDHAPPQDPRAHPGDLRRQWNRHPAPAPAGLAGARTAGRGRPAGAEGTRRGVPRRRTGGGRLRG